MDRKLAFIVAIAAFCVFLLSSAAVLAQDTQGQDFVLTHMWNRGDTVRYKITQDLSGSRTLPGAQNSTPIACQMTSVIRVRFVKSLTDNGMEIAIETESASLKLPNKEPRSFAASKEPRIYRIAPSGRVVQVKDGKDQPKASSRSVLDNAWLEPLVVLATFPEAAIKIGQDVPLELQNPLQADAAAIKASFKVDDLKQSREGWIATIKQTLGLPEGQAADGDPGEPTSRIDGKINFGFIADKGRLSAADGTVKTVVRIYTPVPGMPQGDLPTGAATSLRVEQLASKFTVETLPPVSSGRK